MAMTGNYTAMNTADTVFLKNKLTNQNIAIYPNIMTKYQKSSDELIITSNDMNVNDVAKCVSNLKKSIFDNLNYHQAFYWDPVVNTFQGFVNFAKISDFIFL